VVSLVASWAPTSGELWLFPRLSSGVGAVDVGPKGVAVICPFLHLSLPAWRPCLGFGLNWLASAPAALGEVFGSWRDSFCLPLRCRRGMGTGIGFTLASAWCVDVGAICPKLSAVGPLEFSCKLLSGPCVQFPRMVSLSLAVTFSFCVLAISS